MCQTLEYDKVEGLYIISEEILEDGQGETTAIIMGDWNSVAGNKSQQHTFGPHGLGRRTERLNAHKLL
jgi:hypothetical protein